MSEQDFSLLNARLKLQQRHLKEWETLATIQQKVWSLVGHETVLKLAFSEVTEQGGIDLRMNQVIQLKRTMLKQRQDRQRLKAQHQEEKALLNQLYLMPK